MACLSVSTSYPYWVAFASLVRPCYLSLTHTVRNLAMIIKRRRFIFFHLFLVFFAAKYDRYSDSIFFIARGSHGAWPSQCNIIRSCTLLFDKARLPLVVGAVQVHGRCSRCMACCGRFMGRFALRFEQLKQATWQLAWLPTYSYSTCMSTAVRSCGTGVAKERSQHPEWISPTGECSCNLELSVRAHNLVMSVRYASCSSVSSVSGFPFYITSTSFRFSMDVTADLEARSR